MQAICERDSSAVNFRRPGKREQLGARQDESRAECKCHPNEWSNERAADTPLSPASPSHQLQTRNRWRLEREDCMRAVLLMGSVNVSI